MFSSTKGSSVLRKVREILFYFLREAIAKKADTIGRSELLSLGVCFGKFTKGGKFRLHITALDHVSRFAKYKIWIKGTAEMSYLYGNNVLKAHVAKMTEDTPEHQGVVIYSQSDIPLGFAVMARSSAMCARLEPTSVLAFHQTDIGEYLRCEDALI